MLATTLHLTEIKGKKAVVDNKEPNSINWYKELHLLVSGVLQQLVCSAVRPPSLTLLQQVIYLLDNNISRSALSGAHNLSLMTSFTFRGRTLN